MSSSPSQTVSILGVGALGSHAAVCLRNEGITLQLVDFDVVEQRNAVAQFCGRPGVGKNKTVALAQLLDLLFGLKVTRSPVRVDAGNIEKVVGKPALILDCFDDLASRRAVQDYVRRKEIPCLHGALAAAGAYGVVEWDERFTIEDPGTGATCDDGRHLPFIVIVSAYLSRAAQTFLRDGRRESYRISPTGSFSA